MVSQPRDAHASVRKLTATRPPTFILGSNAEEFGVDLLQVGICNGTLEKQLNLSLPYYLSFYSVIHPKQMRV